jgi:S-adenosylhomocysteine hydrolase
VQEYTMEDGRRIYLLGERRLINLPAESQLEGVCPAVHGGHPQRAVGAVSF